MATQQKVEGQKEVMSEFLVSSAKKLSDKMGVPKLNGYLQTAHQKGSKILHRVMVMALFRARSLWKNKNKAMLLYIFPSLCETV